ncbi:DNA recombination protein RmuC [Parendozoicomonas haliclonae]|uniref:DNA recombination protein RmuC n=1 Tax=Parendozoicomonas haliclonae TaxID=1960125 RepID=A0A1X7AMQ6_9GAMM|nr:DNA recombination protein RmuC [Parendozoicomonas haliclonae]SMA49366.1 DNA recombination protein RmuC [Parendozoicomonas haliclonae]
MTTAALLFFVIALLTVLLSSWLSWRLGSKSTRHKLEAEQRAEQQARLHELVEMRQKASLYGESIQELKKTLQEKEQKLEQTQKDLRQHHLAYVAARKELEAATDKLALLEQSEKRLGQQFENLANRIFENKASRFSSQSKVELESLLGPFKQQIADFRQQVSQAYDNEAQQRRSLRDEITGLKELNQRMSEETLNLTKALKGDKKLQGNWGELVLDRVLEESGLREGHEYVRQISLRNSEGERQQPDVIVHLPDGKDVIIDSKVSLVDYNRAIEADNDVARDRALSAHVQCLRNHIRTLGAKSYQDLDAVRTLDYVLMFIPVEAAFYSAIEHQPGLFQEALDNNIMLVSPTNLLVTLRTIENIWRYEHQNRNAQQIAEKAAALYDKLRGFTEDMQKLGNQLDTARKTYDGAMNKFSTGRGNAVSQAQKFVELGVKVKKPLSPELVDRATTELDDVTFALAKSDT